MADSRRNPVIRDSAVPTDITAVWRTNPLPVSSSAGPGGPASGWSVTLRTASPARRPGPRQEPSAPPGQEEHGGPDGDVQGDEVVGGRALHQLIIGHLHSAGCE